MLCLYLVGIFSVLVGEGDQIGLDQLILLRAEQDGEGDEWLFYPIEDEDQEMEIYDVFMKQLFDDSKQQ